MGKRNLPKPIGPTEEYLFAILNELQALATKAVKVEKGSKASAPLAAAKKPAKKRKGK